MNKKLLTLLCVLALLVTVFGVTAAAENANAVAEVKGTYYDTIKEAINAVDTEDLTATVITLQKPVAEAVTFDKTAYLNLNGHNIGPVTVAEGCILYCYDTETDDYQIEGDEKTGYYGFGRLTVDPESKGEVKGVAAGAGFIDSYLMVTEDVGVSFHRVNLQLTDMTLRHKNVGEDSYNPGLYYKSNFIGDELVAKNVSKFGIALSVMEEPNEENFGINNLCSAFDGFVAGESGNSNIAKTSVLLKSVLKESNGNLTNYSRAQMPVFGRAYVLTSDGDYVFGRGVQRSFKEQVTLMCNDTNWPKLSEEQETEAVSLYRRYVRLFRNWDVKNLESAVILDKSDPVCDGESLKILAITSSFGLNTTELLYDIALDQGFAPENVTIGRTYASGCTLKKHLDHAPDKPLYWYTKITGDPAKTETPGEWMTVKETGTGTLLDALQDEDWDIIFMQQSAAQSPILSSYRDYIDQLKEIVDTHKTNPNARFVWNMLWAYQGDSDQTVFVNTFKRDQMAMYNANVDAVMQKVIPRTDFDAIIPSGTAIQNARTSFFGDTLTKDTYHLNNLGRIIAAYTLYATITGKPLEEINLGPVSGSYDETTQFELLENQKPVIIESVNNALADPFHVTQSQYPTEP